MLEELTSCETVVKVVKDVSHISIKISLLLSLPISSFK